MAAVELVVELVVGETEVEEAELPQTHVFEVQIGDVVRFQPVRTAKGTIAN